MPNPSPFSLKLAGVLSSAALVGLLAVAAARQTPPKTSPGSKSPVPSPSDQRQRQPTPPPTAKSDPPPAAKSNPSPLPAATSTQNANQKYDDLYLDKPELDETTGLWTGTHFTYRRDDTVITGDKARHNNKTRILDAEGNLTLDDPKHHVTGDKAHVERDKSLAVITGNIVIVLKPEKEEANAGAPTSADTGNDSQKVQSEKKHGGTVTCDRVDDDYKRKYSILNGHLVFKQHILRKNGETLDRTLTAEHAEYDGKQDKMVLFKPVDGTDSDGQKLHTDDDVIIGTKEGAETIQFKGKVFVQFVQPKEDDADKDNKPPAKPEKNPATPGNTPGSLPANPGKPPANTGNGKSN
jgi:hypothetical protein